MRPVASVAAGAGVLSFRSAPAAGLPLCGGAVAAGCPAGRALGRHAALCVGQWDVGAPPSSSRRTRRPALAGGRYLEQPGMAQTALRAGDFGAGASPAGWGRPG